MQLSGGSVCRDAVALRLLQVKSSPPCKIVPKCAEGEGVDIRLLRDSDRGGQFSGALRDTRLRVLTGLLSGLFKCAFPHSFAPWVL